MTALAMVFSVQQGEHGPLVVYKLKVPERSAGIAPTAPPAASVYVLPSRTSRTLGTLKLSPAKPAASGVSALDIVEQMAPLEAMLDWQGDGVVTLEDVNNDLNWRRETAEKLRQLSFTPRF
jgi:hypothetical protein